MLVRIIRVLALSAVIIAGINGEAWAQCPGADPNDWTPDDQALQACIDSNVNVYLVRGYPGYMINEGLRFRPPAKLLASNGDKAILIAGPDLFFPMLWTPDNSGYEIRDVIFDGRKGFRFRTDACNSGDRNGINLELTGDNFHVHHIDVINAMCKHGALVTGGGYEINSAFFANNGFQASQGGPHQISNGIHAPRCSGGFIHNNWFVDNSDVNLAIVAGYNCLVLWNEVSNYNVEGIAGINVGDTPGGTAQDLTGAVVAYNTINSGYNKLPFGLIVGPHPWSGFGYTYANVGEVRDNTINGAVVNLAIDGISAGYIGGNMTSGHQGDRAMNCPGGFSAEVTAAHFGSAAINQSWIGAYYHDGGCGGGGGGGGDATNLQGGATLSPGQTAASPNGRFVLTYQWDGNLVLYDNGSAVWAINCWPGCNGTGYNGNPFQPAGYATMQTDGNFVVYNGYGGPVWHAGTYGNPGAYLSIRNDGGLAVYGPGGNILWQR